MKNKEKEFADYQAKLVLRIYSTLLSNYLLSSDLEQMQQVTLNGLKKNPFPLCVKSDVFESVLMGLERHVLL